MGLTSPPAGPKRVTRVAAVFILVLFVSASVPATATVYDYIYGSGTGTVENPSVTLGAGTAGSSSISSVAADAATATITAGLTLYENANAPASNTPITVDTDTATPAGTGSTTVTKPGTAYLWSPQYASATTFYAGSWVLDMWVLSAKAGTSMDVTITTVDSTGAIVSTIVNNQPTLPIAKTEAEVTTTFTGAAGSVPANGFIEVALTAPTGAGTSTSYTVFWGTGQLTNFKSPSTYNYVLSISNSASVSWNVNLATLGTMTSNLGRLTATVSFVSPASNQIIVTGGTLTQGSGTAVALASLGTIDIQVVATASAVPTATNVPSTITFSLMVASTSSTVYAQYTIVLTVN
ncbi:MAG: hypothetical protein KGI38_10880 [Thaumarchaeota archaeon]|nr:hypothetical protein [Nitrososphaerota archaeon]